VSTPGRRIIGSVDVELRFVQGCPNLTVIRQLLVIALEAVGRSDTQVRLRLVRTSAEAEALDFVGSPTVLINGSDPFPRDEAAVGLSCRLYRRDGGLSGSPSVEQLVGALAASRPAG
jgi:hypothetical protein